MTINLTDPANHPANSPLTGERIERVIEALESSLKYRNGSSMDNVLADAVKGLRELRESREAVPVAQVLSSRAGNDTSTIDKALPDGMALYTAPPAPASPDGWIPVSERVPDGSEEVLCAKEFDGPGDWRQKVGYRLAGKWTVYGASWTPTHWMPLPAAPKEVG